MRTRHDEISIGDAFSRAGYHTAWVGKWHLHTGSFPQIGGPDYVPEGRDRLGFQHWRGYNFHTDYLLFVIYHAIAIAVTRMRAELGSPIHDLHFVGPDQTITDFVGTRRLKKAYLSMFSLFWFFNRSHYSDIMPHQLEGFKIAERTRMDNRGLLYSMVIAIVVGIPSTFWAVLHLINRFGAANRIIGYHTGPAWESFNRLQRWLTHPTYTNWVAVIFTFFGFLFTISLMVMRVHFIWWPFHPTGYAISGSWAMGTIWTPILISWGAKWMTIKYGGLKAHRRAIPFFIGLILGEFAIGSVWSVMDLILNIRTYKIWV
jgi:hypothetical protein